MTWDEFFTTYKITDPQEQAKLKQFGSPDKIPQGYLSSLGMPGTRWWEQPGAGVPGAGTQPGTFNPFGGTGAGAFGSGDVSGFKDMMGADRQAWLDFIAPANQTFKQFLTGVNPAAESAIGQGASSATGRLMEDLAGQGTTSSGLGMAMKSAIERGAVGQVAQSRLATQQFGLQGLNQQGGQYAGLLGTGLGAYGNVLGDYIRAQAAGRGQGWMYGPNQTDKGPGESTPGEHVGSGLDYNYDYS